MPVQTLEDHAAREDSSQLEGINAEERRERRQIRREKQREDNIKRAAKMHAARVKAESKNPKNLAEPNHRFSSDAPAGVTGNGGTHFMKAYHKTTGSGIT